MINPAAAAGRDRDSPEIAFVPSNRKKSFPQKSSEPLSQSESARSDTSTTSSNCSKLPCRHPDGCSHEASTTADLLSHIEKDHWKLKTHDLSYLESSQMREGERAQSSERSSNSGELSENPNEVSERISPLPAFSTLSSSRPAVCPWKGCGLRGTNLNWAEHFAVFHPEREELKGGPSPESGNLKEQAEKKEKNKHGRLKRSASTSSSVDETVKKRFTGKEECQDDVTSGSVRGSGRYAGRLRGKTGPDTSLEFARREQQRKLTRKIGRILRPKMTNDVSDSDSDSDVEFHDDPLDRLRAIASVLSYYIYEINEKDGGCTKSGSGYCTSYVERLESLLDDTEDANIVVDKVNGILRENDESKVEYQKPDPNLLELIRKAASRGKRPPTLLMCSNAGFYGKDLGDAGWGCGYRNAQMLISSLLNCPVTRVQLEKTLGSPAAVPNITRLQELIHNAWHLGFDRDAADELGNGLLETSKWIGPTEIFALFSSLHVECVIKDFSNGKGDLQEELFKFCHSYFQANLKKGFAAPLYIQYSGHSRTVIGMDVTGLNPLNPLNGLNDPNALNALNGLNGLNGLNDPKLMSNVGLLIFDPGESQWDVEIQGNPTKNPTRAWYKSHIFCPMTSFKEQTFQILYFTGKILTEEKYKRMMMAGAGHETSTAWCDSYP